MFKKVYTPIDNSDISDKVLNDALDFVKVNNAILRIAHVVNFEQIAFGAEMVGIDELKNTLIGIANNLLKHVKEIVASKGVKAEIVLLENYGSNLPTLLIEDANSWGADLFILGSHHLGSLTHLLTGGVVEGITHNSEIPILLVTKHTQKHK